MNFLVLFFLLAFGKNVKWSVFIKILFVLASKAVASTSSGGSTLQDTSSGTFTYTQTADSSSSSSGRTDSDTTFHDTMLSDTMYPSSNVISNFFSLGSFWTNPVTSTGSVSSTPVSPSKPVSSLVSVGSIPISMPFSSSSEPPCDPCNCNNKKDVGHPQPCQCPAGQTKKAASGGNVCCKAEKTENKSWPHKCGGVTLSASNINFFPCGASVEKNCGQCTNGGFQSITVGSVTGCCCDETPDPWFLSRWSDSSNKEIVTFCFENRFYCYLKI